MVPMGLFVILCGSFGVMYMHAGSGMNGLMDPVEPGLACGSDTAHMSLFGYDPRVYYRGRGAFESMGAGMEMLPGDIAFKSNFAVIDEESGVVVKRRADRNFEREGPLLCQDLDGTTIPGFDGRYTMFVKYATEHRCGVVIRGPGLTDVIQGTDPLKDNLPLMTASSLDEDDAAAVHTAQVVNAASDCIRSILREHPVNTERRAQGKDAANVILLRGCGCRLSLDDFNAKHGFASSCMVAPTKIIAGVGMSVGMTVLDAPGATGDYRSDFSKKAKVMVDALSTKGFEFGFLHVKAVDDAGHDGNTKLKMACIDVVDAMVGQLIHMLYEAGENAVIGITGDHSTPVEFGDHSHEPVPFAVSTVYRAVEVLGGPDIVHTVPLGSLPKPEMIVSEGDVELAWKRGVEQSMIDAVPDRFVDSVTCFDELEATKGYLGRFTGNFIIPTLQKVLHLVP